eukprot:Skav226471  [mRNA]  locus=scaffold4441:6945:14292:- [translate_table: standard]
MEAPSLERSLTGSTGASAETEARLFKEFIDHHNRVLEMASDSLGRAEVLSGEEAQKLFRQADKDHNHRLDKEEFFDYMKGLLSVGLKQFESICATLVAEETLRRAVIAEGFDRKSSATGRPSSLAPGGPERFDGNRPSAAEERRGSRRAGHGRLDSSPPRVLQWELVGGQGAAAGWGQPVDPRSWRRPVETV